MCVRQCNAGHSPKPPVTPLGKELWKLRDKYIASGGVLLNRRELEREVAEPGDCVSGEWRTSPALPMQVRLTMGYGNAKPVRVP
jgi:hypothetical protein